MTTVQFFTTPAGETMAVLPGEEYEALARAVEDMIDARDTEEALARIASGEDTLIPADFAERILEGENPVRVWREFRGLTIKALAASASISAAYLSQIEGGSRMGTVVTMKALADALGVTIDDLI